MKMKKRISSTFINPTFSNPNLFLLEPVVRLVSGFAQQHQLAATVLTDQQAAQQLRFNAGRILQNNFTFS